MFVCYSSVLLFTASLPGRETFMFHYLIDSMSITLLSFHVGSSSVRTTAPMKLSSSRCAPRVSHFLQSRGRELTVALEARDRLFPAQLHGVPDIASSMKFYF